MKVQQSHLASCLAVLNKILIIQLSSQRVIFARKVNDVLDYKLDNLDRDFSWRMKATKVEYTITCLYQLKSQIFLKTMYEKIAIFGQQDVELQHMDAQASCVACL